MNLNRRVPNGLPGGVRGRKFYYFLLLDCTDFEVFKIDYVYVTKENIEQEHICCAIRSNSYVQARSKKD